MITAADFLEPARSRGFAWYTGVPCSFLTPFIDEVLGHPALTYVAASNEGDAVAFAAGAALGGVRCGVLMQNSGLGNAVSPLTSLTHTFRIPVLLVVTWRGAPGLADAPQHALMGRITHRMLEAMEIPWAPFPTEAEAVAPALAQAEAAMAERSLPFGFVMAKGSVARGDAAPRPLAPRPPRAKAERLPGGRRTGRGAVLE
ncbi:MAG: phosphonopyruvate decarboxylase, partial [Nitrospirae bacterium]